ncbi:HAD family hydrolase [Actinomadura livida]|uniref:Haloacid dehalogenase-like hydrolase n=1 Tax=Actinomadura livida TaxID=79909 RepID=A0A7W7IBE4_9ACTN|nr:MULTISPECIES: haloacid dehalogenase-like hydrolase [Actinomadura]MBB4774011.1 phosphoglycolate phosphatase-like HAD superfamily hydrolase [Actinomadura catellatispora]GGT85509.1 haloacid dehalogenase [Actinomadura livida]
MHKLILWDIDHTLIETGGVGGEVFKGAFEQVTGHHIDRLADVTGRTEQVIFSETLDLYDIQDPGDYFPKFVEAQAAGYRARADEMRQRGRALPGAREALQAFAELPHITQTVLTGNPKPSAIAKLETFDLAHYLDLEIGAYGTDDSERPNLVQIAQGRATTRTGHTYTRETTFVVGDTVSDVEAAREGGAQVIAVATGHTKSGQLRDAGAVTVLASLTSPVLIDAIASIGGHN